MKERQTRCSEAESHLVAWGDSLDDGVAWGDSLGDAVASRESILEDIEVIVPKVREDS